MDYIEKKRAAAKEGFLSGLGCCQAVLCAFKDELGLNETTLVKIGSGFGGGIARQREVCGTVSGLTIAAGLLTSSGARGKDDRDSVYAVVRALCDKFKAKNGSIVCRELLKGIPVTTGTESEPRDKDYYKRRPCPELCGDAAAILAEYILSI